MAKNTPRKKKNVSGRRKKSCQKAAPAEAASLEAVPADSESVALPPARADDPTDPENVPKNPDALHAWILATLGLRIARRPLAEGHAAPFDYLCHAFFEGRHPAQAGAIAAASPDCIVWANRGGGKTFLGALATLLDLLFKKGCQVRILAGSVEQGLRMHEHLRSFLEHDNLTHVKRRITARRIALVGRESAVEILAASQTSVRGTRVQKLRCDEVDLFEPEVWTAAQLVTRSLPCPEGPWGNSVRGSVEALSTMHRPYGMMWKLVGDPNVLKPEAGTRSGDPDDATAPQAARNGPPRAVFRWGVLDVLERCGDEHSCEACPLHDECAGRAKETPPQSAGHITIADAVDMKRRVGRETWESEMLCLRPSRSSTVYPEFDAHTHVFDEDGRSFAFCVAGMDFASRSESVLLLAGITPTGQVCILREHCGQALLLARHIAALDRWKEQELFRSPGDWGRAPVLEFIGADPAGRAISDQTGKSSVQVMSEAGYKVRARSGEIAHGVCLARRRIAPAWGGPGAAEDSGEPRLMVHRSCVRLIECLKCYRYDDAKPESLTPLKDGHDHACDALRYMLVNLDAPHIVNSRSYLCAGKGGGR